MCCASQICRSGLSSNRRIWLTRHGESEFNRAGLIGGDAELTDKGKKYAHALARALFQLVVLPEDEDELLAVSCWTSTLRRTVQTAKHIPFPKLRWKALDEIHAGICDGHTYEQIKEKWPETYAARKADKLNFRYPAGESYMDVVQRLESVIIEVERECESVCIVGHQAILRVLYSYFMQVPRSEVCAMLRTLQGCLLGHLFIGTLVLVRVHGAQRARACAPGCMRAHGSHGHAVHCGRHFDIFTRVRALVCRCLSCRCRCTL